MNRTTLPAAAFLAVLFVAVPVLATSAFAGEVTPCHSEYMKFGASGRIYSWQAGC